MIDITKYKNLVILAGHGIRAANAHEQFTKLINKLGIPVMTTWRASDLIEHDHPLFYGRPGLLSWDKSERALKECDLLLCIGCRMDLMQTMWNPTTYYPNAKKAVVDIDQTELDKLPDNWIKICMDAGEFINELI
jgi:acetolactate synthase I/II/III large subunit